MYIKLILAGVAMLMGVLSGVHLNEIISGENEVINRLAFAACFFSLIGSLSVLVGEE